MIDPLLYGTYLGAGSTDYGGPITPAPDGGVYVTGMTYALSGFPTTPGAYDETGIFPGSRPFVSHFDADGAFLASTLFGEEQTSENRSTEAGAYDIVYDSIREGVWMCGVAYPDWPLTPDAIDTTIRGLYDVDAFLLRFSSDLTTLEYCSYLGGNHGEEAHGITLDSAGKIYVAGGTFSDDFPISSDALYSIRQGTDGFLWVYDPESYGVVFSSFLGGERRDRFWGLELGEEDEVWLYGETNSARLPVTENAFKTEFSDTGEFDSPDAFLAHVDISLPSLSYCSYLGGHSNEYLLSLVEVDSVVYMSGRTSSPDFPYSHGAFDTIGPLLGQGSDGFVGCLNWLSGVYIGSFIGFDRFQSILTRGEWVNENNVTVAGYTNSSEFPTTPDAFDTTLNHGEEDFGDAFVMKLDRALTTVLYSTYVGGSQREEDVHVWVENCDSVWICGTTESFNLPVTPDAFQPGDNAFNSAFLIHFAIDTTADTSSVAAQPFVPDDFSFSVYPNPFNPTTTLSWSLPRASEMDIVVHNLLGQEIERVNLGRLNAGKHVFEIRADEWPSGIYFARVTSYSLSPFTGKGPGIGVTIKLALIR